ncbi:MAG: hypothetical protein ACFFC1_12465 [Promethearchaeota archaeon]
MNEIQVNWNGHVKKYQAAMEELNLDFCVLTRVKEENMVEIAAVVFNRPDLGGVRLESPTLVTKKGAEILPKTPFEVDYV